MDKGKEEKINLDVDTNSNVEDNVNVEDNSNAESSVDEKIISVYLDRIEELEDDSAEAVLFIDDGGDEYSAQIHLPADCLPENVSDGDYLTLKIAYDEVKTKAALESARQLLND